MTSRADYFREYRATRSQLGRPVSRGTSRPVEFVAWDGEGETVREASGFATGKQLQLAVRDFAAAVLADRELAEAPFWNALDQVAGGRLTPGEAWDVKKRRLVRRGEYDDVPRHLMRRARGEGNADLIAQAASSLAGYEIETAELLAFFIDHPRRPSLSAAIEEAREQLEPQRPQPADHRYTLLANSRDGVIERGERLGSAQLIDALLAGRLRYPHAVHCFFGGGYDATMILRDCSRDEAERLWAAGRYPVTVLGGAYAALYRPRRSLWLARFDRPRWRDGRPNYAARTQLWDVWGFFQGSFVAALRSYGFDPAIVAEIEAMKARRPTFSAADRAEVEAYCVRECELLEELMRQLAAAFAEAGLKPRAWNGAGAVAAALLQQKGVKSAIVPAPEHLAEPIARAYFGGRIELCQLGWAAGEISVADIVSAYPWAASELPDLRGSWEPCRPDAGGFSLHRVRWRVTAALPWYPLPYRTPWGTILFPATGEGWYWRPELEAAQAFVSAYGGELSIGESWQLVPAGDRRPFAFIPELYRQRKAWQLAGNGAEKAAKLGLNSLYGKMAQQLGGSADRPPPYHALAWAGWVTSATRARLVRAALCDLDAVIAFATDGILSTRPLADTKGGEGLGSWECTASADGVFAQAGVYWLQDAGGSWKARYRGFDREGMETPDRICDAWNAGRRSVEIPCTRFVGLGSALCSPELWEARGTWRTVPRELDLTGRSAKRMAVEKRGLGLQPLPVQWNVHFDTTAELSAIYKLAWDEATLDGAPERLVEQEAVDGFI